MIHSVSVGGRGEAHHIALYNKRGDFITSYAMPTERGGDGYGYDLAVNPKKSVLLSSSLQDALFRLGQSGAAAPGAGVALSRLAMLPQQRASPGRSRRRGAALWVLLGGLLGGPVLRPTALGHETAPLPALDFVPPPAGSYAT